VSRDKRFMVRTCPHCEITLAAHCTREPWCATLIFHNGGQGGETNSAWTVNVDSLWYSLTKCSDVAITNHRAALPSKTYLDLCSLFTRSIGVLIKLRFCSSFSTISSASSKLYCFFLCTREGLTAVHYRTELDVSCCRESLLALTPSSCIA
jgi:hypothetical protein